MSQEATGSAENSGNLSASGGGRAWPDPDPHQGLTK